MLRSMIQERLKSGMNEGVDVCVKVWVVGQKWRRSGKQGVSESVVDADVGEKK